MQNKTITVNIENGLEARPIALLVQEAGKFDSRIHLEIGTKKVNAKSIMGMMSLGLTNGDDLTIIADGSDEEAAVAALAEFLTESK
ncbi:MAG: HPr family phosphocarrier protein [Lachnospiraceae bacterium]|nr:HPr family phosphocarrier protein [Lachnospiraceae bacterium]